MLVFTILTALLVSLVPAIQAGRAEVNDALQEEVAVARPVRAALNLTVVQATLSVVLLVIAGLFLRSVQRVNAVDLGMQADRADGRAAISAPGTCCWRIFHGLAVARE